MSDIPTYSPTARFRGAGRCLVLAAALALTATAMADPHGGGGHSSGGGQSAGGAHMHGGPAHSGYASGAGYHVQHGGGHYWYQGGYWYRPYGGRWIIGGPPYGAYVPWLPWGYSSLWIGGYPYYYYNNAYYVYRDEDRGYEVVPPPEGAAQGAAAIQSDNLFAYPRNGQSAEQQATDRYECHKWANEQTGYDPTQAGGGVAAVDAPIKRADYFRATTSCLEGRGYSVK